MNRLAISFLSLLTLSPVALAQGAELDMASRVKAGTTVWFAELAKNEQVIDMAGQEMTSGQTLTRTFSLTIKEVTAEGNHVVEIEVARIHGTMEMPMMGEMKIDSAASGEADEDGGLGMPELDEMKNRLTEMAGKKFLAKVGPDGKVIGKVQAAAKGEDSEEGDESGEAMKQLVESAFGYRPKSKVAEGGKWDHAEGLNSGQMPLKTKATATLVKAGDDAFETMIEGAVEKDAGAKIGTDDEEEAAMAAEMLAGMKIENGKLSGKQHLSRKDGLLVDSNTMMTADITMDTPMGSMGMKMKSVTTIKRITEAEARPAKKAEKKEDGDK